MRFFDWFRNVFPNLPEKIRRLWLKISGLRAAYAVVFDLSSVAVRLVLQDLDEHGYGHESTFHRDPYEAGRRQGRREMLLRIWHFSQHPPEVLWEIHKERLRG